MEFSKNCSRGIKIFEVKDQKSQMNVSMNYFLDFETNSYVNTEEMVP